MVAESAQASLDSSPQKMHDSARGEDLLFLKSLYLGFVVDMGGGLLNQRGWALLNK